MAPIPTQTTPAPASQAGDLADHLDDLIPLRDVPALLPRGRGGKRVHIATLYRWTDRGCRGVRLRHVQCGATRATTRQWLADFLAALTAAGSAPPVPSP